jgi:uncharacterized protein (DUF1330 family)
MPAYLIANYKITKPDGYRAYTAAVGATIVAHGGQVLVAGPDHIVIEGNPDPITIVLKFPSMEALRGWYDSSEYQEILHLRTDSSEGSLVFADEFVMPGS